MINSGGPRGAIRKRGICPPLLQRTKKRILKEFFGGMGRNGEEGGAMAIHSIYLYLYPSFGGSNC